MPTDTPVDLGTGWQDYPGARTAVLVIDGTVAARFKVNHYTLVQVNVEGRLYPQVILTSREPERSE